MTLTPDEAAVERVARAMQAADQPDPSDELDWYLPLARAAMAAMVPATPYIVDKLSAADIAALNAEAAKPGVMIAAPAPGDAWQPIAERAEAEVRRLRVALETIRSGLRNLPASTTAARLDEIAAAALATPASPPQRGMEGER